MHLEGLTSDPLGENPGNNIPKEIFDMNNIISNNDEHRAYF